MLVIAFLLGEEGSVGPMAGFDYSEAGDCTQDMYTGHQRAHRKMTSNVLL